jgi:hypothetical protein
MHVKYEIAGLGHSVVEVDLAGKMVELARAESVEDERYLIVADLSQKATPTV